MSRHHHEKSKTTPSLQKVHGLPRVPGGLVGSEIPRTQVESTGCVCGLEVRRGCKKDKIKPRQTGCIRSDID